MGRRYTDADLAAILTKQGLPVDFKYRKNHTKRVTSEPSESQSQQAVVQWWARNCASFHLPEKALMAFPLQGARTPRNGARMKAEGCRKGTLDMLLAAPKFMPHFSAGDFSVGGLWIEMKTSDGVVSPEQREMIRMLRSLAYRVCVCRSTLSAVREISNYLTGDPQSLETQEEP